jgi:hypothetical protein
MSWNEGIFRNFDRMVQIRICGRLFEVPENNNLLRCLQFIDIDALSSGNYCWNGDCSNCKVWYTGEDGQTKCGLACKVTVQHGMVITALSSCLQTDLSACQAQSPR